MSGEADRPQHARYNDESGIYDFFFSKNCLSKHQDKQWLTSAGSELMQTNSHNQVKQV